ncbi:MAG TPA: ribonuclease HII [Gemmatimonadales bacterium]|nr:ribonuclease HII [Gemmatimonadales bacterium]
MAADRWSRLEREFRSSGQWLIAGIDEVGRGPLAGPVVACAIVMSPDARCIRGVADSKKLSAAERERLAALIGERALAVGVAAASVREIDRLNILRATTLAMRRALDRIVRRMPEAPHHILVDGRPVQNLGFEHTAVVGGDATCYSIACASIIAKVTRDDLMSRLAARHRDYGWERNSGYGTAEHREALLRCGRTPHHRTTFGISRQLELELAPDGE